MMPMRHAPRGLDLSDMQRCTCAIEDLEDDKKICLCKASISSSSHDDVPSAMRTSGINVEQEKERKGMTICTNNCSFFSSSCGNVLLCVASARTSWHNEDEEGEVDMNICTNADSSLASSRDNVPSSIVLGTHMTTSGDVVTHSGASSVMQINSKEDEEVGVTSTAVRCIMIMPIGREEDEDGVGCITPKAREYQIPEPLMCPPPPPKKLKKNKINQNLVDAGCTNKNAANGSHSFFKPPRDLHTYPNCIRDLFKNS